MTVKQAASEVHVPTWRIWNALARGDVAGRLTRRGLRIDRSDWLAFLDD